MESASSQQPEYSETPQHPHKHGVLYFFAKTYKQIGYVILLVGILALFFFYLLTPPVSTYPKTIIIKEGMSLKQATEMLKDTQVIRSQTIANFLITLRSGEGGVVSGTYVLKEPHTLREVVTRVTTGSFGLVPVTIRINEGATIDEITESFAATLENFDPALFTAYLTEQGVAEGFLFPDTYKFLPTATEQEIADTLTGTFDSKVLRSEKIRTSKIPLQDIVVMGSIIEKEADAGSRQEVSNILWKRIAIDMPLQVDASFVYSIEKATFDLTLDDLQDEDNPYNTYVFKGLPPTAISNPSLAALEAAAQPQETNNLYFLTGADGEMYYATSFEEHKANRRFLK